MPAFTPPTGDAVNFEVVAFTPPAGDAVDLELDDAPEAPPPRVLISFRPPA
jgi:hypothetical protein